MAITAVASITLVAVGVIRIKLVVTIAPFLGAFVVFTNVFVLEMGTITAYRWIPVSGISLRPWGASGGLLVRRSPRPSFRRGRGTGWGPSFRRGRDAGWRRFTLPLGFSSVAVLTDYT